MKYVDVYAKAEVKLNIDCDEAFRILCKSLDMAYMLDETVNKLFVNRDSEGDLMVYHTVNGHDEVYDSRGALFIALANVAVNIFPNLEFRGADYIYEYGE
jgi:hypothetical protein